MVLFNIYVEVLSLLIGLIGIFYVFGNIKLVDHRLYQGWRWVFLAYIFFILSRLIMILDYSEVMNLINYISISILLFITFVTLGMIKFNKEIRNVIDHRIKHRIKHKKRHRKKHRKRR